ncbi:MAG TPA: recombination protein RecR [Verrucomicrobia bacterium]|nr:MAG: recombination protein RecR [Lentisphaerae bacterium GWF2_57_35]HBA86294.1 recombination protein RecR [Verrucomicrobiota bacterium]
MNAHDPLNRLTVVLSRLPGIGRRSAERIAVKLTRDPGTLIKDLVLALQEVEQRLTACSRCGNITLRTEDPCRLCTDSRRDSRQLCVVEDPSDISMIERAGDFNGRYHALMGKLSPMKGEGMQNLRVDALIQRIHDEKVEEVILALNSDVESDATASFLAHALSGLPVRISRLAFGIPAGSEISYSDPVTLARALHGRQPV